MSVVVPTIRSSYNQTPVFSFGIFETFTSHHHERKTKDKQLWQHHFANYTSYYNSSSFLLQGEQPDENLVICENEVI